MEARVTASRRLAAKLLEMSQSTREEPASGQGQRPSDDRLQASFLRVLGCDLIDADLLGSLV